MSRKTSVRDGGVPVAAWLPYAVAPCCTIVALPATLLTHHAWEGNMWAAVGLAAGGTVVTGYTWVAAQPRGPLIRKTATVIAGGVSLWALGATISGPLEHPWVDTWALGGVVTSAILAVSRVMRRGGDPADGTDRTGGLAEAIRSLKDARIGAPKTTGARVTASVVAASGTPFSAIAADRDSIESALDVRPGAVRFVPDPDSARRGRIEVVPVDQLKDKLIWPGPTAPGRSIADAPATLGRVEDGEPLELWLPGDTRKGRNSTHVGVVGMSGSGKTELLLNLCADVLTRTDAEVWVADPRKADQLPEWLRDGAHRFRAGPAAVHEHIDGLSALIRERAGVLGRAGHKQWVKGCGLPFLVLVFFEAAGVLTDSDTIVDVAESARSVGISLVFELQRATYDRVPTSVRANIGSWICLGIKDEADAAQALSDSTLDAGAMPWVWKDQKPGYLYAELSGTDPGRWMLPARAFVASSESERGAAIGPWLSKTPTASATRPAAAAPDNDEGDDADAVTSTAAANDAWDATDPPDDVDPAAPLPDLDPDAPRLSFGPPPREMTPQEAREHLRTHVLLMADAGTEVLRPSELADVLEVTGRSGSWLYGQLQELTKGDDALLDHTEHGVYRVRPLVYA